MGIMEAITLSTLVNISNDSNDSVNVRGLAILLFRGEVITLEQLEAAICALKGTSGEAKYRSLFSVLDEDHDGNIALEEMAEVISWITPLDCTIVVTVYIVMG